MALGTFLRGIGNGEWVPKWNTQKRAGMREFLLFIGYLSILIIIMWIIFPPSNGKIPGVFFFHKESHSDVMEQKSTMGRAIRPSRESECHHGEEYRG